MYRLKYSLNNRNQMKTNCQIFDCVKINLAGTLCISYGISL